MEFQAELANLLIVVIVACVGFVTKKATAYLNSKGVITKLENNKLLVEIVVRAVEQSYVHLHGEKKLNMAKLEVVKLMKANKIKISEKEIDLLIESSVKEMNQSIKEELKK